MLRALLPGAVNGFSVCQTTVVRNGLRFALCQAREDCHSLLGWVMVRKFRASPHALRGKTPPGIMSHSRIRVSITEQETGLCIF